MFDSLLRVGLLELKKIEIDNSRDIVYNLTICRLIVFEDGRLVKWYRIIAIHQKKKHGRYLFLNFQY